MSQAYTLNPSTQEGEADGAPEFEDTLISIISSRPAKEILERWGAEGPRDYFVEAIPQSKFSLCRSVRLMSV